MRKREELNREREGERHGEEGGGYWREREMVSVCERLFFKGESVLEWERKLWKGSTAKQRLAIILILKSTSKSARKQSNILTWNFEYVMFVIY